MFETQCFNFWTCLLLAKFNQCLAFQLHNLFVIVSYWNLNHINNELCSIKVSNNTIEHIAHQICCIHFLLFHLDLLCVTFQDVSIWIQQCVVINIFLEEIKIQKKLKLFLTDQNTFSLVEQIYISILFLNCTKLFLIAGFNCTQLQPITHHI